MALWEMKGKTALVTGGAKGIGAACVTTLARAGAKVILSDVLTEEGDAMALSLREKGHDIRFVKLDVTSSSDWEHAVGTTLEHFEGLDVLVNNAGVETAQPITEMTLEDWRRIFSVNMEGVFLGTKHAVSVMQPGGPAGRGGSIINISSVASVKGFPGFAAYGASKSAVRQFTKIAAIECGAKNIRVNSVLPGVIRTDMGERAISSLSNLVFGGQQQVCTDYILSQTPLGGLGESTDVAAVVLFLASDDSRFVSGTEMVVDGGLTA